MDELDVQSPLEMLLLSTLALVSGHALIWRTFIFYAATCCSLAFLRALNAH
jgi:hypothetical protein